MTRENHMRFLDLIHKVDLIHEVDQREPHVQHDCNKTRVRKQPLYKGCNGNVV